MSPDLTPEELEELQDPMYLRRTHGHHKTYDAGCRGPLCAAAAAYRGAIRYRAARIASGLPLNPRVELTEPRKIKLAS